ncbi:hypothetical protein ABBQ38_008036 [Trebouxia sp. C0009 RCD-2024]
MHHSCSVLTSRSNVYCLQQSVVPHQACSGRSSHPQFRCVYKEPETWPRSTIATGKKLAVALLAAGLLVAPAPSTAAGNTSMIDQIHFYQAEKEANSPSQRAATPAQLLEMAAAQLGKVETLIGIGQYESARLQLRQGAASTIRLDLKAYDRSRHTGPDEPQAGKAIVKEVETLDLALKQEKPADECKKLVRQIRQDMTQLLATP